MDSQKVEMFILSKAEMFPPEQLPYIRERLLKMPDEKSNMIYAVEFKDTTIALILSLILGCYGIDRFFIGDIGLGVGKLLTCGGCGIWAIVDWFLIREATRKTNFSKFSMMLSMNGC